MRFLGVDLGWSSNPSGLCCLELHHSTLTLVDLRREHTFADIFAWIDRYASASTSAVVAVDAPTLIPNQTGMRLPDRLAHRHFGRYHAGCYPANLGLPFAARTVGFGLSLEERGFDHAPTIAPRHSGRYQIEVFPHPAMIHLFQLERIIKYKKGTVADRRLGLSKLRHHILEDLPTLDPPLALPDLPDVPLKGTALKALEDQLDSIICAYVAAHWWYWGLEKNWVLGDRAQGYIIVPAPFQGAFPHE
jgi:predicted RNase H-like nuclease